MGQTVLSILGLVMVSVPRRVVAAGETLAFVDPDDAVRREWTIPLARIEGIGYLLLVRRTTFLSGVVGTIFGLFGSFAAVHPRQYLEFGLTLAYENPDDITPKTWVIPATRALGLVALVLTVVSLRGENDG